jgi:hypothetical protein
MTIVIEGGDKPGIYGGAEPKAFLDAIAVVVNTKFPKMAVKNGPLPLMQSKDHYRFASMEALARYMLQINERGDVLYHPSLPEANPAPKLTFDPVHGMYHFGGEPTVQKSKWNMAWQMAQAKMEPEIKQYLARMRESYDHVAWYIGAQDNKAVGNFHTGVRGGKATDKFTIQAQVDWIANVVSYHGFPDEKLIKPGLGKTKTSIA